ncbi:transposon Tf2-9 polyprotein [Trichonephila clavipes]|nr:transposon Tf2-9 polyprotein [Trichonephila clavipes]
MDKDENFANYTSRGYLMNQGILYRYSPEIEEEEAQLVVPVQERERILQEYHDALTAGHYGVENTLHEDCIQILFPRNEKSSSQSTSRLVLNAIVINQQTKNQQDFENTRLRTKGIETRVIDLFGPLPETPIGKKWIFIVEDISTKWVELFALSENCAKH